MNVKEVIKDAFIAKMTGIADYKNGKEIKCKEDGMEFTIEFVDDTAVSNFIIRMYGDKDDKIFEQAMTLEKKNGKATSWRKGIKLKEETYKDGALDGISCNWYLNGVLASVQWFKDGKLNGVSTSYNDKGNKIIEEEFRDGKFSGNNVSWQDGVKTKEMFNTDDKYEYRLWSPHGILTHETITDKKNNTKTVKNWYMNGQKKSEEIFKDESMISSKRFDADGTEIVDLVLDNGPPVCAKCHKKVSAVDEPCPWCGKMFRWATKIKGT